MRIVDLTLEILSSYLDNTTACKLLSSIPVVKQLATAHITQFRILQDKKQHKQLSQFYRVLTGLWIRDDFVQDFHLYLSQLNTLVE